MTIIIGAHDGITATRHMETVYLSKVLWLALAIVSDQIALYLVHHAPPSITDRSADLAAVLVLKVPTRSPPIHAANLFREIG